VQQIPKSSPHFQLGSPLWIGALGAPNLSLFGARNLLYNLARLEPSAWNPQVCSIQRNCGRAPLRIVRFVKVCAEMARGRRNLTPEPAVASCPPLARKEVEVQRCCDVPLIIMSIGPVLELADNLAGALLCALDEENIRVEQSDECLIFRKRGATLKGRLLRRGGREFLWLTFSKSHAFNPMFWLFDFSLSNCVVRILKRKGAWSAECSVPSDPPLPERG
jgi:hypothetical protein